MAGRGVRHVERRSTSTRPDDMRPRRAPPTQRYPSELVLCAVRSFSPDLSTRGNSAPQPIPVALAFTENSFLNPFLLFPPIFSIAHRFSRTYPFALSSVRRRNDCVRTFFVWVSMGPSLHSPSQVCPCRALPSFPPPPRPSIRRAYECTRPQGITQGIYPHH